MLKAGHMIVLAFLIILACTLGYGVYQHREAKTAQQEASDLRDDLRDERVRASALNAALIKAQRTARAARAERDVAVQGLKEVRQNGTTEDRAWLDTPLPDSVKRLLEPAPETPATPGV